jgi:hypothetical protein
MRGSYSKRRAARSLGALFACLALGLVWAAGAFAAAPTIESESISGLTHTDVTLEADIDTGGLATHYQFRLAYGCGFGLEACPQFCIAGQPCPGPWNSVITVPLPAADLDPSGGVQHVSLDLNSVGVSLEPYKYRYSVEAANTDGGAHGDAKYFTPASSTPPTPSAPSVESESVSKIRATEATLGATVDPGGLETEYEFWLEYNVCQNADPGSVNCAAVALEPRGEGTIPAGYGAHAISKKITGLNPGYTYRFWVVATNTEGEDTGSHRQFTMLSATPGAPVVQNAWTSDITTDDVTLHATIDPNGLDTAYKFFLYEPCPEAGPGQVSCQAISVLPLPGGTITGSFEPVDVSVSADEGGYTLNPGTKYEWAIRATNEEGQTFPDGPDFFTASLPSEEEAQEPGGGGGEEVFPLTNSVGGGTATTATTSDVQPTGSAPQKGNSGAKKPRCKKRKARQSSVRHRSAARRCGR